ncbi:hypothetical protein BS50DRAFT_104940 [Corynespora cassiicola Philippines]|uniref:Uncharacterized protein n=1 Tax=Corynespora cassiicola Philippines TaxID=1448308 RepID=A0A2T2NCN5_CORCC|nr:hypothetical protein BS50DRAFT_104940 [Corynespora cassiicola Philippines]
MDTDSDAYSATDSPIPLTRAANDRRLHQAINYLHAEGGSDPAPLFVDRVQKIDDAIIHEYPELGLDYNPRLYARLQSMVDEVQDDFQRIREEVMSEQYSTDEGEDEDEDESVDYDVPVPEEVLYRNLSVGSMPAVTRNTLRDKGKGRAQEAREPDVPLAEVRKRQWIYGGPHNEVEEWFKELPPSLPFGETLYMQEWESMKIDYDLRESAQKASNGDYTAVKTNVPYGAPEASSRFQQRDFFDSGSRFKLPHASPIDRARFGFQVSPLEALVKDFNEGSYAHARQKDYAPRVFLTKIDVNSPQNQTMAAGTAVGKAKAAVIDITSSSSDSESSEDDSFEEEYTSPGKSPLAMNDIQCRTQKY